MVKNNIDNGVSLSEPFNQNIELPKKVKDRLRFVRLKVGKILKLDKKRREDIVIPEHTLSRMFQKDTTNLKKRFNISSKPSFIEKVKKDPLGEMKKKFEDIKSLLQGINKNYQDLHVFEILYYTLLSIDPEYIKKSGVNDNSIKTLYIETLSPAIRAGVSQFDTRGEYTPPKKRGNNPNIDIKKLRKILQFRDILHHYGFSDENIGVPREKFDEMKGIIQDTISRIKSKK